MVFYAAQGIYIYKCIVVKEHIMSWECNTLLAIHVGWPLTWPSHSLCLWHRKAWTYFPLIWTPLGVCRDWCLHHGFAFYWPLDLNSLLLVTLLDPDCFAQISPFASILFLLPYLVSCIFFISLTGDKYSTTFFLILSPCWRMQCADSFILSDSERKHLTGLFCLINVV